MSEPVPTAIPVNPPTKRPFDWKLAIAALGMIMGFGTTIVSVAGAIMRPQIDSAKTDAVLEKFLAVQQASLDDLGKDIGELKEEFRELVTVPKDLTALERRIEENGKGIANVRKEAAERTQDRYTAKAADREAKRVDSIVEAVEKTCEARVEALRAEFITTRTPRR